MLHRLLAILIFAAHAQGVDNPGTQYNENCNQFGVCNSTPAPATGTEVLADSTNAELLADPTNAYILTH